MSGLGNLSTNYITTILKESQGENRSQCWRYNAKLGKQVKYLGVTFDNKLKFDKPLKETEKKATQLKGRLCPLTSRKSAPNTESKLPLMSSVFKPSQTY